MVLSSLNIKIAPNTKYPGRENALLHFRIFSHPDCTVGSGISPDQSCHAGVAGYTAGGEFHPAPKILVDWIIHCGFVIVKGLMQRLCEKINDSNRFVFSKHFQASKRV
jgi:hypothetical protein